MRTRLRSYVGTDRDCTNLVPTYSTLADPVKGTLGCVWMR